MNIDIDIFRPGPETKSETKNALLKHCFDIRRQVFIEEQNVDLALEMDAQDDKAFQVLVQVNNQPVGTARFHILTDKSVVKVERVAVLKEWRRKGLADRAMEAIEGYAKTNYDIRKVTLNAQITAVPFYENRGYQIVSDSFLDAGIVHYTMTRDS